MVETPDQEQKKKEPPAADTRPNPPGWQE